MELMSVITYYSVKGLILNHHQLLKLFPTQVNTRLARIKPWERPLKSDIIFLYTWNLVKRVVNILTNLTSQDCT